MSHQHGVGKDHAPYLGARAQRPGGDRRRHRPLQPRGPLQLGQSAVSRKDLLVIGGGISGAAVALAAARRGLSVLLVERHDYASGASSNSSKLVHGGLR